ncbi:MAG TPA: TetR/AcrR family transcriptional regulator [Caulobacteraceae bacterium]|nr:TetR/AcrR family transcriptional regulator [Caulobacteraceae bacterium]
MKKQPTQGRSRQMVDALIEATARTIAERGWPATTTNHVASRAGVSVGSLYQYFESREDLLAALMERERARILCRLEEAMPSLSEEAPRIAIRRLLEIAFEEGARDEPLFIAIDRDLQSLGAAEFADILNGYMLDALRLILSQRYAEFGPMDAPTVAFMLSNGTVMVVTRFFSQKPKGVTQERLLDELTDLYAGYFESKLRPRPSA